MIHLREKDLNLIQKLAKQIFTPGTKIWAYGSRVKGTHHEASDLDLTVHAPLNLSAEKHLNQLQEFQQALQDSNLPIFVQVFSWGSLPEKFQENINAQYEILEFE